MHTSASGPPGDPQTSPTAASGLRAGRFTLGLRAKIALVLLATLLVTLTVNSLLTLRAQERDILEEADRRGREIVQFIAQHVANDVVGYNYHGLELTLRNLIADGEIARAEVTNLAGNVMAAAGTAPAAGTTTAQTFSADIRLNGELLGRMVIDLPTERLAAKLKARQRDTLIRQLVAILAVLLAAFVALSLIIIRPLSVVSRVLRSNLNTNGAGLKPIPLDSADELGDLARAFNALQQRLGEAQQRLRGRIDVADRELHAANLRLASQAEALRAMNRELEQLSVTDPLTGLYNRRYFVKLIESEIEVSIRNDETISILLLDIDRLRELNDRLGHRAGDDIIRQVAQRIGGHIRPTDVACRYGGDEFFILCRRATIANAVSFADDLQRAIAAAPVQAQGESVPVTVTIGAATIPGVHRVQDPIGFFRCADEALRHGKQNRQSVVHFSMLERSARLGVQ